ncbi:MULTISPECIES: IS66 family insertion sequence element accessory protein TnpB [Clostridium]|uniref:IS66 family insertion sequence element accessory protein TnpB n=1 Tax=Clostridium TaxID=1485 RepID=UPI0035156CB2
MNERIKTIYECRSSAQTVKSWCTENSIKYYYWLRKVCAAVCKAFPSKNPEEQTVLLDTFKLSGTISIDADYVFLETDQTDIVHFDCSVLGIHIRLKKI